MKITALELASVTMDNNRPIDRQWINHIKHTYSSSERLQFCRENVEYYAPENASKQLIGRAAKILENWLF